MTIINYESDFKIVEGFKDGSSILAAPFKFTYYTKMSRGAHVASYDGTEFVNCHPTSDGRVVVPFDNPQFGLGVLNVKREFFLNDKDFADGICNLVSVESTGIVLDRGATDMDGEVNIELFPFYQRGLDGKDGKSAYDLWLEEGNEGSVADFLGSLKGGQGSRGEDGADAYEVWLQAGNEGSVQDFLDSLKGEDGKDGVDGENGVDGKSFTYADMTDAEKKDLASHVTIPNNSVTEDKLSQEVQNKLNQGGGGGYQPPVGGIPKKDLSQEVQESLEKADTALQEHQDLSKYAQLSQVQEIAKGLVTKDVHTSDIQGLQEEIEELASTMITTEPAEGEEVTDYVLMLSDVEQKLGDSTKPISQAAVKSAINSIESMIVSVINTPT